MVELWLKYKDPNGDEHRIAVDKEKFVIGRHSDNDLSIADGRLSREHALIDRFGDIFVISDRGSSNGTEINGAKVSEPTVVNDGDSMNLGGLEIELQFISDDIGSQPAAAAAPEVSPPAEQPAASAGSENGLPKSFFVVAAIFGALIIVGLGAIFYLTSGNKPPVTTGNPRSLVDDDDPPINRKVKNSNSGSPANGNSGELVTSTAAPGSSNVTSAPTPAPNDSDAKKTELNASAFLRKIAQNDPRAFIIGGPAETVKAKIKSLSGAAAVASNINSARRNAPQIKALAILKNLKPELLAVAAIAKLNGSTGDVLQTATTMAPTLDRLSTQNPAELGEECLVIIAAYDQGEAGDFFKMRNMLQDLATKMPEQARDIRTIWYLKKHDKITDAQFDLAVRFLAIGAISQNPKDFGVNAEALTF